MGPYRATWSSSPLSIISYHHLIIDNHHIIQCRWVNLILLLSPLFVNKHCYNHSQSILLIKTSRLSTSSSSIPQHMGSDRLQSFIPVNSIILPNSLISLNPHPYWTYHLYSYSSHQAISESSIIHPLTSPIHWLRSVQNIQSSSGNHCNNSAINQ
jgi:hypothetical protein